MRGTKTIAILIATGLAIAAAPSARADHGRSGHSPWGGGGSSWGGGGGGADAAQIAGGVLGIIGGALGGNSGNNSNGWGHPGGSQNNFGNNWLNTTPKYRWKNVPQYEMKRVYHPGPEGDDGFGQYKFERVQTGTKRVRVQDGYQVTPNVGKIIRDIPKFIPPPAPRPYHNDNYVYPRSPSVQPTTVVPNRPPVAPKATPTKPNKVEAIPAKTAPNSFQPDSFSLTDEAVSGEIDDLQEENGDYADTLKYPIKEQAKKDVDALAGYDEATKNAIKERIENEESFDDLLTGADPVTEGQLLKRSDLVDRINALAASADDGEADSDDLATLATEVIPYVAGDAAREQAAAEALLGLNTNSTSIAALQDADLDNDDFPFGCADLILVGGLDEGQVASLGNGTVLVGTGDPDDGTYFGTGNVAQLAGYTAGIGEPAPDTDSEEITDGVVLRNAGTTPINYNVNNHQYTMEPGYRQVLPGGKTWTVTFDRGNSHGTAKYGVSRGTYEFTPTEEQGWDLFKQESTVTIANDNPFTFNFVIENRQETLAPGQEKEYQSEYPQVVRFDDGRGNDKKKRLDAGEYRVAVSPDGSVDVYEATEAAPPVKIADVIPDQPTPKAFFKDPKEVSKRLFTRRFTPEPDTEQRAAKRSSIFGNKKA